MSGSRATPSSVSRIRRRRAKVPLRIGDVWVLIGPRDHFRIVGLAPRPTFQKPDSQAVTLSDGRTIAEATLRYSFQRKAEHDAYLPVLAAKWQRAVAEFYGEAPSTAQVIQFKPRKAA